MTGAIHGWRLLLETLDERWPRRASALRAQYQETIRLLSESSDHEDLDPGEVEDLLLALAGSGSPRW